MGQIKRIEDWPILLARYLSTPRQFCWGENDCIMFSANAILEVTGVDFAEEYRGTYTTEEEANQIIKDFGGIVRLIGSKLGNPSTNVRSAGRGDVALVTLDGVRAAGIIDESAKRAAVMTQDGIRRVPLSSVTRVWSY